MPNANATALPPALAPLAAAAIVVMLAAIGTAWGFQVFGGYVPCALCLEQRVPYYVAIPLALVGLAVVRRAPALGRILIVSAAVAMAVAAALGVYHAGAEWGFWEGPTSCGGTGSVTDASTLLDQLEGGTFVSCTTAAGRFLGLSFAGWNVVAAGAAALILLASICFPVRRAPHGGRFPVKRAPHGGRFPARRAPDEGRP